MTIKGQPRFEAVYGMVYAREVGNSSITVYIGDESVQGFITDENLMITDGTEFFNSKFRTFDEVNRAKKNERKKQKKTEQKVHEMYSDSNDEFYYIAGYTSGGAPYGITWTEMGLEPYGEA